MKTLQLDVFESSRARDEGIERAKAHADEVSKDWSERAGKLLIEFMEHHVGPFMVEELRSYAALVDFDLPAHSRAWGGVIRSAAFKGLVERVGIQNTSSVKSHRTPASVWVKK